MNWEKFFSYVIQGIVVFVLTLVGYLVVRATDVDGKTDYCYIALENDQWHNPPCYELKQHREWRQDRGIACYPKFEEAKAVADSIACPLK